MSDSISTVDGPLGLTIPPPRDDAPLPQDSPDAGPAPAPELAPLPAYQGTAVDESI
jgi:hypothetical protein